MVKIVQLLCPHRHCVMGVAYEEGRSSFEESCNAMRSAMEQIGIHNWCGICGSLDLQFEEHCTPFATLKEAAPALAETMVKNLQTRAALDSLGLSRDKQRNN